MQVKCNKCGHVGDESEFPKGRDCDMRDSGAVISDDAHEAMRYMEDQIRICYRKLFGAELGQ